MTSGTPAQVGAACTSDALLDRFQLRGGPVEAHVATLAHRVEQLEAALRDAREYLLNCPYRASDTTGREWNRVMDVSAAALSGVSP